jgi:uncharacterized coiled-coil DUF342 family protein
MLLVVLMIFHSISQERVRALEAAQEPQAPRASTERDAIADLAAVAIEREELNKENRNLRERMADLRDEIDELKAASERTRALALESALPPKADE